MEHDCRDLGIRTYFRNTCLLNDMSEADNLEILEMIVTLRSYCWRGTASTSSDPVDDIW